MTGKTCHIESQVLFHYGLEIWIKVNDSRILLLKNSNYWMSKHPALALWLKGTWMVYEQKQEMDLNGTKKWYLNGTKKCHKPGFKRPNFSKV